MALPRPVEDRFWEKVVKTPGCWIWTGCISHRGYGCICRGPERGYAKVRTHRLAWELNYGPVPAGLLVCHTCDNPSCVRPDHLFLGTNLDNSQDMVQKGRSPVQSGVMNHSSKLTEAEVLAIRADYAAGMNQTSLARKYNLGKSRICCIVNRYEWTHI